MPRLIALLLTALAIAACSKEPAVQPVQQPPAAIVPAPAAPNGATDIRFNSVKQKPVSQFNNPKF